MNRKKLIFKIIISFCSIISIIYFFIRSKDELGIVRIGTYYNLYDVNNLNKVLEKKGYPYRLELTKYGSFSNDYPHLSGLEKIELIQEHLDEIDILLSSYTTSQNKYYIQQGMVRPLRDDLQKILPQEMYPKIMDDYYIFPKNPSGPYNPSWAKSYYAIVKNEIVEKCQIKTRDDIIPCIQSDPNITFSNPAFFIFNIKNIVDADSFDFNLGIAWDESEKKFIDLLKTQTKHFEDIKYLYFNRRELMENGRLNKQADIIYNSEIQDGYTGFEYQSYKIRNISDDGWMITKNASKYSDQFIYDLYTDPDLSMELGRQKGNRCQIGNLEFMSEEVLDQCYSIKKFQYQEYVDTIKPTFSVLHETDICLLDVISFEQIYEIEKANWNYTLGAYNGDENYFETVIERRPPYFDQVIEDLNQLAKEKGLR